MKTTQRLVEGMMFQMKVQCQSIGIVEGSSKVQRFKGLKVRKFEEDSNTKGNQNNEGTSDNSMELVNPRSRVRAGGLTQ